MTLRKRDVLPLLPVTALIAAGFAGATGWIYADIVGVLLVVILLTNPLWIVSRYICPELRYCGAAAVVLLLMALQMQGVDPVARALVIVIVLTVVAVFTAKNREWLTQWRFRHSEEADRVQAHLRYDGAWCAGDAWERAGLREVRSLLHIAFALDATEDALATVHKAVWQLGYLHGMEAAERDEEAAERTGTELEELKNRMTDVQAQAAENEEIRTELQAAKEDCSHWWREAQESAQRVELLRTQAYDLQAQLRAAQQTVTRAEDSTEDKDAAIVEYVRAGHSYAEAAAAYGMSKTKVFNIVKAATTAETEESKGVS